MYKLARFDGIDQSDIQSILVKHLHTLDASYVRSAAATLEQESGIKSISTNLNVVHGWIKKESRMKE
ncbi:MAG: hypothetical protein HY966_07460 [Ignavibacteriales bacterium]|nr:hypothetical protein [Ignavibacteriales bacterium]